MPDATEPTRHGFTPEQMDWLEKRFKAHAKGQGSDRGEFSMFKWVIGGLFVFGLAATGYLSTQVRSAENELRIEIGSVRDGLGSVRSELREEIAANRTQIAELARGQARIEAILEERLPRNR